MLCCGRGGEKEPPVPLFQTCKLGLLKVGVPPGPRLKVRPGGQTTLAKFSIKNLATMCKTPKAKLRGPSLHARRGAQTPLGGGVSCKKKMKIASVGKLFEPANHNYGCLMMMVSDAFSLNFVHLVQFVVSSLLKIIQNRAYIFMHTSIFAR